MSDDENNDTRAAIEKDEAERQDGEHFATKTGAPVAHEMAYQHAAQMGLYGQVGFTEVFGHMTKEELARSNASAMRIAAAQTEAAQQRVVFLDMESSPAMLHERLTAMGVELGPDHPLMAPVETEALIDGQARLAAAASLDGRPAHPNRAQRRAARKHHG